MTSRAVVLDLWGTLVRAVATGAREQAIARVASVGLSEADFLRGWGSTWEAAMRGELRCMVDRVKEALRFAGISDPDLGLVDELTGLMHVRWRPYLFPDVRPALAELRARGYPLGLISNTSYDEYAVPDVYDLRSFFGTAVMSCDAGMAKPEPAIYRLAAERLGVAPEECAFVDDTRGYVAGARAVGMTGVLIERPDAAADPGPDGEHDVRVANLWELLEWLPAKAGSVEEGREQE